MAAIVQPHYERFADDPNPPKCDVCQDPSVWRIGVAYGTGPTFFLYACYRHRRRMKERAQRTAYVGYGVARVSMESKYAF